jgi:hypothetical protein
MAGVSKGVSLTHAFKFHRNKKKKEGRTTVNESTFRKVCYSFNKKLGDRVLTGFHTQLPYHMGFIRIVGRKGNIDKLSIDFKATKEYGETIYHDNRHTDGHYYFWNWQKPNHLVKNMQHYTFLPTRGNKGTSLKEKLTAVLQTARGYKLYLILK